MTEISISMNLPVSISAIQVPLAGGAQSDADLIKQIDDYPRPVILIRTPYVREHVIADQAALNLARQGWVIVVQSVRGRLGSDGEFRPFLDEDKDGSVALAWCASQPWCDGRIFLQGKSYEGYAAWAAARSGQVPLCGIVVSMTAASAENWFYEGGAFRQSFAQSWGLSLVYTASSKNNPLWPEIVENARNLSKLYSCPAKGSALLHLSTFYQDWLRPSEDAFWDKAGRGTASHTKNIPAFILTGWHDIFLEGALADYISRQQASDSLVIGPWSHDTIGQRRIGQIDYGVYATTGEFDVLAEIEAWKLAILDDIALSFPVRIFVMGINRWIATTQWPPLSTTVCVTMGVPLDNVIKIGIATPAHVLIHRNDYVHSPGGRVHQPQMPLPGGHRAETLISHTGCAIFTSTSLDEDILVVGPVRVQITAGCKHIPYDLSVWLMSISSSGAWVSVVASIQRTDKMQGTMARLTISLGSTAYLMPKGSRIALVVGATSVPDFDVCTLSEEPIMIGCETGNIPSILLPALSTDLAQRLAASSGDQPIQF